MITEELLSEKRWPQDEQHWPQRWNRVGGLLDLCRHAFGEENPSRFLICETGIANGVSTEVLSHFGAVHAVDITLWEGAQERFKRLPEVTYIWSDTFAAADAAPDGTYDMVYIDTVHEYDFLKRELLAWLPKIKKGGIIAGHDYGPTWPGVQRAVAEVLNGPDMVFSDTSWMNRMP